MTQILTYLLTLSPAKTFHRQENSVASPRVRGRAPPACGRAPMPLRPSTRSSCSWKTSRPWPCKRNSPMTLQSGASGSGNRVTPTTTLSSTQRTTACLKTASACSWCLYSALMLHSISLRRSLLNAGSNTSWRMTLRKNIG